MSVWQVAANGNWVTSGFWDGPTPDAPGAVAEFNMASANSALFLISFSQGALIDVGTLNILSDSNDGWSFRGAINATAATLRFEGVGGSPAFINVDTNGSTQQTAITNLNGLEVVFASDVILTTLNSDTDFLISAPIRGSGDLYKFGAGTLLLGGDNGGWLGDLNLLDGRTEIVAANALADRTNIELDNEAVLVASSTRANRIEVGPGVTEGTIATTGNLVLTGQLVVASDAANAIRFGTATDTGTIVLAGTSVVTGGGGFTIDGGIVRLGNASVAASYFSTLSATGFLQIAPDGTLDTAGHATAVDNLDMDGGILLASSGVLDLIVTDTTIGGNGQSGTVQGTAGADRIIVNVLTHFSASGLGFTGWTAADTITINGSNVIGNTLVGSAQADIINGNGGNDTLRGGGAADMLSGGTGNDTYEISDGLDTLVEAAAQGLDTVVVLVGGPASFTLATNFENLTFLGGQNSIGTGNTVANVIIGGSGADMLNGAGGADRLEGKAGDDYFFVDVAADQVVEAAGEGADRVFASASWALAAGASVETITTTNNAATTAINLTGNEIVNMIVGNAGANILDGKGGADLMSGLGGDDFYYVDDAGDRAAESAGAGSDRVFASVSWTLGASDAVETITTTSNAGTNAINLTGNGIANTIYGNAGANVLDGKGGADILVGLAGADVFSFTTAPGAGNVDRLVDVQAGVDKIALDNAVFTQIGANGALNANAFVSGAAAADASDRIVYNATTGQLFYDADGTGAGAAVLFATLDTKPALTAGDFTVI